MESSDAQLAKMQMYINPARCPGVAALGEALDRWGALGRELSKPLDDDFKLIALRGLVPKHMAELMTTQASLRAYPEALMYVRRQVAEHRHHTQVQEVQRQSRAPHGGPMDLSPLYAAIAALTGGGHYHGDHAAEEDEQAAEDPPLIETLIAALKGKGKGKSQKETRECYNCGKTGHLARDCLHPPRDKGQGKGAAKGEHKGKGAGKTRGVHALEGLAAPGEAISLRCLLVESTLGVARAEPEAPSRHNLERPERYNDNLERRESHNDYLERH